MAITLRPPTDLERARLVKLWTDEARPETSLLVGDASGDRFVRIGRSRTQPTGVDRSIGLSPRLWFRMHRQLVQSLVDGEGGARVAVACLSSVPEIGLGWLCWSEDGAQVTLHWLAVEHGTRHSSPRRRGIGLAMLREVAKLAASRGVDLRFSHMTPLGLTLLQRWRELDEQKGDTCTTTTADGGSTTTPR